MSDRNNEMHELAAIARLENDDDFRLFRRLLARRRERQREIACTHRDEIVIRQAQGAQAELGEIEQVIESARDTLRRANQTG